MCDRDVCNVEQTWWYNLTNECGTLLENCSWSGTTICNTGYNGRDNTEISFIGRVQKLLNDKYFEKNRVDTLFLFGGTNDSWADAPLGEGKKSAWSTSDLYNVLPAFSYLVNLLISEFPNAKIYCILNTELKSEITDFYKSVCEENNIDIIELSNIDKIHGHPTIKGMQQITEQILDCVI